MEASPDLENIFVFLCGGILIAVMFFGGIFSIFWSLRSRKKAAESGGWPAVVGVITNALIRKNVSTDSDGYTTTTFTPTVEYQYNVGGYVYTGNRISFGFAKNYSRKKKAQEALTPYPHNGQVNIFYNPKNPHDSVLVQEAGGAIGGIIGGVVLIVISLCVACPALGTIAWNNF
jgi:hypothetical protein